MTNELISIIVPVFNLERELKGCVESILKQSYSNLEILLVDDGSADRSWDQILLLAKQDSRIVPIHQENGGVTSARLAGVSASTGEYIGFVDGDDRIDPEMFERLLANAKQYHADIAHCGYQLDFPDGSHSFFHNTGICLEQDRDKGLIDLLAGTLIEPSLCNKLYRRHLFDGVSGQMDGSIHVNEDLLMNFYLFKKANKSVFEDYCPYHYIVRPGSVSRRELNASRISDPIQVKQLIVDSAPASVKEDAERAYINTVLDVYASMTSGRGEAFQKEKEEVRGLLLSHWDSAGLLSPKRRALANLIRLSPPAYTGIYRFYARFLKKDPYRNGGSQ